MSSPTPTPDTANQGGHTPGPWIFQDEWQHHAKSSEIRSGAKRGNRLCEAVAIIPHDDVTDDGADQMLANARLIAAAPDMLEAMLAIHDFVQEDDDRLAKYDRAYRLFRAAIDKATGARP